MIICQELSKALKLLKAMTPKSRILFKQTAEAHDELRGTSRQAEGKEEARQNDDDFDGDAVVIG